MRSQRPERDGGVVRVAERGFSGGADIVAGEPQPLRALRFARSTGIRHRRSSGPLRCGESRAVSSSAGAGSCHKPLHRPESRTVGSERMGSAFIRRRSSPRKTLVTAATTQAEDSRAAAAAHPACPFGALAHLAEDWEFSVRSAVAARVDCPPDLLDALINDSGEFEVPLAAAGTVAARGGYWLQRYARDDSSTVREAIANHIPATNQQLFEQMSRDPDMYVRMAVGWNPACPPAVLGRLTRDPEDEVVSEMERRASARDGPRSTHSPL